MTRRDASPARKVLVYSAYAVVLIGALILVREHDYWTAGVVLAYALGNIAIVLCISQRGPAAQRVPTDT
jgi:hypothetical protein